MYYKNIKIVAILTLFSAPIGKIRIRKKGKFIYYHFTIFVNVYSRFVKKQNAEEGDLEH